MKDIHFSTNRIAKTREQIADQYGISTKTLKKWFNNAGLKIPSGLICPSDQEKIYQHLGVPQECSCSLKKSY